MLRITTLLAVSIASLSPATAKEQSFAPEDGQVSFLTPSNNIQCTYTPKGGGGTYVPEDGGPEIQCDRAEPDYLRFILGKAGKGRLISDVGDSGCCGGTNVLDYGSIWSVGPFTCVSSEKGLTCIRDDGHGFFISKARTAVF